MKTNKEVIRVAKRYIGQGGTRFRNFCGLPKGAAWCNAFVDYVANEAGVAKLYFDGKKETYCPNSLKWCKKNLVQLPPSMAMPADVIYLDWELNKVPNHIGLVLEPVSTSTIQTIEGNTNGGIVAKKSRSSKYACGIFRPLFVPSNLHIGVIEIDSKFYYNSIANMQRALSLEPTGIFDKATLHALQKKAGCKEIDSVFGKETAMCVQTMLKKAKCYSGKIDCVFGTKSVQGLQKWTNKMNAHEEPAQPTEPEKPKTYAEKIIAKIDELAYAYGTNKKKYAYKGGSARPSYKSALKKYMKKDAKISQSDCGYFVSTVVRSAGISKTFLALRGRKQSFPAVPSSMKIVHKGKIPNGLLKAGDIIRYKKKGGGQHTLIYYGGGKIAEAGRKHYFPAIKKNTKKYNKSNVKKSSIQVIRGK